MSALVPRSRGEDGGPSAASSSAAQVGDGKPYSPASLSRVHSYPQSAPQQKGHGTQATTILGRSSSTQVSRTPTSVLYSSYGSVRTPISSMNDLISAEINPCSASLLLLGRTVALPSLQGDASFNRTRRRVLVGEAGGDERGRSGESPHDVCTLDVSSTTGGGSSAASTRSSSSISSSASSVGFSSQPPRMSASSTTQESLHRSSATFVPAECSSSMTLRRDKYEERPYVTSPSMPSSTHTTSTTSSFSSAKGRSTPFSSLLSSSVTDISRTSALPDFLSLLSLSHPLDFPGKYHLTSQYFVLDSIIQSTAGLNTPVKLPLDTSSSICFEPSIRCALHPPSSSLRFNSASSTSLASQPLCCTRDLPAGSTAQQYTPQTVKDTSLSSSPPGSSGKPSQTMLAGSALKRVLGPHLLLPPAVVAVPLHAPIVLVDRLPVATPSTPSLFFPPSFVSPSTNSSPSLSSNDDGLYTPRPSPYVPSSYPSRPAPPPPPPREGCTFHPQSSEYPFRQASASEFSSQSSSYHSSPSSHGSGHRHTGGGFMHRSLRIDFSPSPTEATEALAGSTAMEGDTTQEVSESYGDRKSTVSASCDNDKRLLSEPPYKSSSSLTSDQSALHSSEEEEAGKEEDDEEEWAEDAPEEDALLTRVEEESLQSPFTGGSIPSPFTIAFVSALKSALRLWAERLTLIEQQQASGNSRLSPIPASCLASTTKEESTKAGEESLTKDHSDRNIFVSSSVHRNVGPSDGNSKEADEGRRNQEVLSSSSFSRSSPPLDPRGVHVCLVIPHIFLTYQSGKLTSISSMLEKGYERRCCNRLRRQLHQYRQNLQQQQQVSSSNLYRDGVSSSSSSSAISSMTFEQNQYQNPANVYKNVLSRDRCMSTSSSSLSGVSNPEGDQSYQPIQGGRGARLLINAFSKSQKDNLSRDERKGNSEVEASTSSSTSPSVNDRVCKQIEEDVAWLPLAYHHQSRVAEMKRKSTSEENMHQEEEGVSLKKDDGLKKHAFKFVSSNHKKTAEAVEGDDGNIYRMVADCQWAGHGLFNLQDDRTLGTDEEKQNPLLQKETELLLDQKYVHGIILASFLEVYIHPKRRLSSVITPPWASSPYPNHSALSAHPMNEGLASKRVTHSSSSMPLHTGGGISSPWIADDSFDVSVVSGSFSLDELRGIQRRFRQNSSGVSVSEFVRLAIEITRTQFSRLGLLIVARPMEALFLSNRLRTTHFSTLFSEALVLYTTGHASLSLPLFHVAFRSAVEVLKNNRKATSHRDFQVAGTMRRGRFSSSSSLGKTEEETRPALARWKNFNSKKSEGNHDEEESHLGKNHVEDHLLTKTIVRSGDSSTGQYGGGGSDAEKTGNFGEEGENERTREKKESALSLLHLVIAWRGAFNLWTREQKKAVIETQEHGEKQTGRDFLSEGWLDETKSGREKNQESVSGRAIKKTVESCVRLCCDVLEVVDILLEALLAPSCSSTTAALNDEVLSMMACRKRETGGWEGLEVFAVVECLRAEAFDFLSELLWMFPSINFIGKDCRAALMQHLSSFSPPAPSTRSSSSSPSQRRNAGSRCRPAIQFPTTRQPPISYCTFGKIPSVEVTSSSFSSSSSSTASSSSTKASLITTIQNDRSVSSPSSFDETVLWSERKTRMSPSSSSSPSHSSPLWLHIAACAFGFKEQDRIPKGSVEELSWKHLVIGASGAFERAYQVAIKLNIKSEIRWDIILSFSSFLLYSAQQVNLAVVILKAHLDVYDSQFSSPSSFPCSSSTSPLTCLTRSSDELTSLKSHGTKKETSSSLSDLSQQEGSSTQHKTDINNDPTSSSLVNSPSLSCSLLVDQARRLYAACSVHVVVLVFDIDTSVLLKPLAGSSCLSIGRMTASSRDMATGNLFLCSSPPQRYYALKSSTGQDTSLSFSSSYMYHRSRGAKGDSSPGIQVERRQKMYQILQQEGSRGEVDSPNDDNNDYSKEEEKSAGLLGRKKYEGRDEGAGKDMVEKFFLCSSTTREKGSKTSMSLSSYSSHRGGGGESAGAPNTFNPFLIPFASCLAPDVSERSDSDDDYLHERRRIAGQQPFSHQAGCALDEGEIILEPSHLTSPFSVPSPHNAVSATAPPQADMKGSNILSTTEKCMSSSSSLPFATNSSYLHGGQPHTDASCSDDADRFLGGKRAEESASSSSRRDTRPSQHWGQSPGAQRAASMLLRRAVAPPDDGLFLSASAVSPVNGGKDDYAFTPPLLPGENASNSLKKESEEERRISFAIGEDQGNDVSLAHEKRSSDCFSYGTDMIPSDTKEKDGFLRRTVEQSTLEKEEMHCRKNRWYSTSVENREVTIERSQHQRSMNVTSVEQCESMRVAPFSSEISEPMGETTTFQVVYEECSKEKEILHQQDKSVSYSECRKELRYRMSTEEEERGKQEKETAAAASIQSKRVSVLAPWRGYLDEEKLFLFELQKTHTWRLPRRLRWVSGGAVVSSSSIWSCEDSQKADTGEMRSETEPKDQAEAEDKVSSILTACLLSIGRRRKRILEPKNEGNSDEEKSSSLSSETSYGAKDCKSGRSHDSPLGNSASRMLPEPVAAIERRSRTQLVCSSPAGTVTSRCSSPFDAGQLIDAAGVQGRLVLRDQEQALKTLTKEITSRNPQLLLRLKCSGSVPLLFARTEGLVTPSPSPIIQSTPFPRTESVNYTTRTVVNVQQNRKITVEAPGGGGVVSMHTPTVLQVRSNGEMGAAVDAPKTIGSETVMNIDTMVGRRDFKHHQARQGVLWSCDSWHDLLDVASHCEEKKKSGEKYFQQGRSGKQGS